MKEQLTETISNKIVERWVNKNLIEAKYEEWFKYGVFSFLLGIINICIFILLGIIFRQIEATILFCIVFCINREYMGGYHCDTPIGCKFASIIIYAVILFFSKSEFIISNIVWLNILNIVMGNVIIYNICPVIHHNKILCIQQRIKFKKIAFFTYNISLILSVCFFILSRQFVCIINITLMFINILALLGFFKERSVNYD